MKEFAKDYQFSTLGGDIARTHYVQTVYPRTHSAPDYWLSRQSLRRSRSHRLGLVAVLLPLALVAVIAWTVYK